MHRVKARNDATESENRIHADDVARQYGFSGGLVPGVTVFAYLCRPPAARWGRTWVEGGRLDARFARPVYDGDGVTVEGIHGDDDVGIELRDGAGEVCATATARPTHDVPPPDPAAFPPSPPPAPDDRPPVSADVLRSTPLASIERRWHAARADAWLDEVGDDVAVYREGPVAHPGWVLRAANHVLARSVRLGPWIHVSSDIAMHGTVGDGEVVSMRGRVADVFERKGHEFVALDILAVVGDRPVLSGRHVAIYRPRRVTPGT